LNINTVPTQAWSAKIARCQSAGNPTEFQIHVAAADNDEMPQQGSRSNNLELVRYGVRTFREWTL